MHVTKTIKMTAFTIKVISIVKKIPRGRVATYGQIAKLAGNPGGSRGVGWILNSCSETHSLPWQRVINSKGQIPLPKRSSAYLEQRRLLRQEGVSLSREGAIDLAKYQWKKMSRPGDSAKKRVNKPSMFS